MRMRQITAANEAGAVTLGESRSLVIVLGDERVVLHSLFVVSTPPTSALYSVYPLSSLPGVEPCSGLCRRPLGLRQRACSPKSLLSPRRRAQVWLHVYLSPVT